jgi:hypothetical protein
MSTSVPERSGSARAGEVSKADRAGEAAAMAGRIELAWTSIAARRDALLAWEAAGGSASAPDDPEASWDPGRILAHLSEMVRYWLGEMERILASGPDRAVTVGRDATDPIRVLSVERDRTLPVAELLERTDVDVRRVAARLRGLDEAALMRRGTHPVRGEMTLAQVVTSGLAKHIEDHAVQLEGTLGATLEGRR